jgi:hypothetical protein
MKYIASLSILLALALPAVAGPAQPKVVIAKSTAEQRAMAELVSARIRAALDGEAYALDKPCDGSSCTVSSRP